MRVTFPRLRDHEIAYAVVERDDGVVYRLLSGRAGTMLPHDIRHLVVERELGVTDGIWGGIAAGAVFAGMRHLRGRRPPPAAERSAELKRKYRDRVLRAELLADLAVSIAGLDDPSPDEIGRLTKAKLAAARGTAPPPEAIAAAARALQVEAARWARLRPGEELRYEWRLEAPPRVPRPKDPRAPGNRRDPRRRIGGRHRIGRRYRVVRARRARQAEGMRYSAEPSRPPEVIDAGPAILRRWRVADLAASCEAVLESREHLSPWMPWAADFSRASQAEFLAGCERDWESGAAFNYALLVDDAIAGSIGLMARIGPGGLEIGYWVHRAYTRRGLATAASAALVEQAFALPGIERVQIVHDELNVASGGVPRKLGFCEIERRPLDHNPLGGSGMGVVWELTRAEWQGAASR